MAVRTIENGTGTEPISKPYESETLVVSIRIAL